MASAEVVLHRGFLEHRAMVTTWLVWLALANVPGSLHARLDAMREQVRQNRELDDEQRALLEAKLTGVDAALTALERTVARGDERKRQMQPVMVVGAAVIADDVSGIGTADDALLPIVALAAALVQLRTQAPASDQELRAALGQFESAIDAAVQAGQGVLMSQQVGKQVRDLTGNVAQNLARILGRTVSGKPPDHQQQPERDRRHWWTKLKGFIEQIERKDLTKKQLKRELDEKKSGGFSEAQLVEFRKAIEEAAKLMNENPPDFPPLVTP